MITKIKAWLRPKLSKETILWSHQVRAKLAARWFGFPGRDMKVIGVTGTNGKTTTCILIGSILEQAGFKVAELSTVRFKIGDKEIKNNTKMTTLSPWILQKFLAQAVKAGCGYTVLEVTSHALEQFRT
jgi:UDP-N-acetylmuramoyl-L-alanyl-D-glutamate--2,6-diaminopimelate ligase